MTARGYGGVGSEVSYTAQAHFPMIRSISKCFRAIFWRASNGAESSQGFVGAVKGREWMGS